MKWKGIVVPALKLFVITAMAALLLGGVNELTADRIFEMENAARNNAVRQVLPESDGYISLGEAVIYDGVILTPSLNAYSSHSYIDINASAFCAELTVDGYAGEINMMVGVRLVPLTEDDGFRYEYEVMKVVIVSHSETMGVSKHGEFTAQFKGYTTGGSVDAISGATISSRAITGGVERALKAVADYVSELTGGGAND